MFFILDFYDEKIYIINFSLPHLSLSPFFIYHTPYIPIFSGFLYPTIFSSAPTLLNI